MDWRSVPGHGPNTCFRRSHLSCQSLTCSPLKWGHKLIASMPHGVRLVVRVAQSCPTLCDPTDPASLLCPWDFPGKNTGVDCHSLLQRIFLTQELNRGLLHCRRTLNPVSYREDLGLWLGPNNKNLWLCSGLCFQEAQESFYRKTQHQNPGPPELVNWCGIGYGIVRREACLTRLAWHLGGCCCLNAYNIPPLDLDIRTNGRMVLQGGPYWRRQHQVLWWSFLLSTLVTDPLLTKRTTIGRDSMKNNSSKINGKWNLQ